MLGYTEKDIYWMIERTERHPDLQDVVELLEGLLAEGRI